MSFCDWSVEDDVATVVCVCLCDWSERGDVDSSVQVMRQDWFECSMHLWWYVDDLR